MSIYKVTQGKNKGKYKGSLGKFHKERVDMEGITDYEELEAELERNAALAEIPNKKNKLRFGAGATPVFSHPEQMAMVLEAYFNDTDNEEWTLTGIALCVGIKYQSLLQYKDKDPRYEELINRAKLLVHNDYEKALRKKGRAGDIFALKNLGWKDKTEVENTHTVTMMPTIKQTTESGDVKELAFNVGKTIEHEEE